MSRHLLLAAAQLGPISRGESRRHVVERLLLLLRESHRLGYRWYPKEHGFIAKLTGYFNARLDVRPSELKS